MATFVRGFCTTLMPRPQASESMVWNTWSGTFTTEGGATHNGERIWDPSPGNSFRSFDIASTHAYAAMEARNYYGTGTGLAQQQVIFNFRNAGGTSIASLRCDNAGNLYLYSQLSSIASTSNNPIGSNTTYYTLEMAYGAGVAAQYSYEVRINGLRIANMTTTDFNGNAGQVDGSLARATPSLGGAILVNNEVAPITNVTNPRIYWYAQKNGSGIWTTVTTGTTFALQTDFVGLKKRAWLFPNAVANYTMPGAGSGTQTSNWLNGAGTYPASIADSSGPSPGLDQDTSYIRNVTSGTGVAADKISHRFSTLPGTATNIGFVQRTVIGRSDQVATSDIIRPGLRSPATATPANTDFPGTDIDLGSTYGTGTSKVGSIYYPQMGDGIPAGATYTIGGTTVWSAATLSATTLEGIVEQRAIT